MKKISKLVVALIIFAVAAIAVVACNPPASSVSEIRIDDSNMPLRTTFVQGQELDLLGGYLTVVTEGEEELIPLDSPLLEISGYNKDSVGLQVLTIKYNGAETTLTVRVAKRIAVNVQNTDDLKFFQGMDFVLPAGELVLTNDDGTNGGNIALGEPDVIINVPNDFSQTPGKKEIGISFGGYTDTFEVEIFEVANRNFQGPNLRAYKSHDTQMDLTGGYILYQDSKAFNNMAGGYQKYVDLTQDMIVEGTFNPAAATYEENYKGIEGNTDLSQDVTFSYGGFTYRFNIQIEFSNVSLVKHNAGVLAEEIDWEDEELELNQDQYDMAVGSAEMYFAMTEAERALFTAEELKSVMTLSAYYLYNTWLEGMEAYEDILSFSMDQTTGQIGLSYVGDNYNDAKAALSRLETQDFLDLCNLNLTLSNIVADPNFAVLEFFDGYTIANYCALFVSQDSVNMVVSVLDFTIQLYDALDGVTLADVMQFNRITEDVQEKMENWYQFIRQSYFIGYRPAFATIEAWRPGYYDIIYTYYYGMAEAVRAQDPSATTYDTNLGLNRLWYIGYATYLPELLETFYTYSQYMYDTFTTDNEFGGNVDSSSMYYYILGLKDAIDAINNSSNQLYKNLFRVMQFAYTLYIEEDESGNQFYAPVFADQVALDAEVLAINYYMGDGYQLPEYEDLIRDYMPIVEMYMSGTYMTYSYDQDGNPIPEFSEVFYTEVPKFFNRFISSTTGIQTMFLVNLSIAEGILDTEVDNYTIFSSMVEAYYSTVLDEDTYAVFSDLLVSYESFLKRGYTSEKYTIDNFVNYLNSATRAYNSLNSDQKADIDFFYNYLNDLMGLFNDRTMEFKDITITDVQWRNRLQEMADLMQDYAILHYLTSSYGVFGNLVSFGAKVDFEYTKLLEDIYAVEDEALRTTLLNALQYKQYDVGGLAYDYVDSIQSSYLQFFRAEYLYWLAQIPVFGESVSLLSLWDEDMRELVASASDVTMNLFKVFLSVENVNVMYNNEYDSVFKSYLALNGDWALEQKVAFADLHFYTAEDIGDLFMQAFWLYYSNKLGIDATDSSNQPNALFDFMNLVYSYLYYDFYLDMGADASIVSEYATMYQSSLNTFNSSYNRLTSDQQTAFTNEFGSQLINAYKTAPRAN